MNRSCDISVTELYGLSLLFNHLFYILSFISKRRSLLTFNSMLSSISISALIALLSAHSALAHGVMVDPKRMSLSNASNAFLDGNVARTPGPEYQKACGGTAYNTEVN